MAHDMITILVRKLNVELLQREAPKKDLMMILNSFTIISRH